MGTRSGDIDPAVVPHLMGFTNDTVANVLNRLNKQSGLLGISGVSSDQRDIDKGAAENNERCQLALEMQAYSIKKYIGSYLAVLNGADAIVFTGGIGENSASVRERICSGLNALGIVLDPEKNKKASSKNKEGVDIAAENSAVRILVIPTNEEYIIARDVKEIITQG
jgi:acetate kinase